MTIYLIRHGRTEANERHLYCGSTDLPLSESGAAELCQLRYDLGNVRFITSGMKRTEQTLETLFGKAGHTVDPRFREMGFGAFEMRSYHELKDDPAYLSWITGDNEANRTPGGESGNQMKARALEAFAEVLQSEQDAVIITHGGVIAAIMAQLFPGENKNRYQWQPKPGHGYKICDGCYGPIPQM